MRRLLPAIILLGLIASGCASASAPSDLIGVHFSGGTTQAKKFKDCLDPSERSGFDPGDKFYFYPTRQISYEASDSKGSERGRFTVVSSNSAELYIPARITFELDTNCETLRKFHEEIAARYSAYIDNDDYDDNAANKNDDGQMTSADYPSGWVDLLNDVIGKPADATLDRIAQNYTWQELWGAQTGSAVENTEEGGSTEDAENIRAELENELEANLEDMVNEQAGGDFFKNFTVLIQKPDPVDPGLKQAIVDEQKAIADANAAKAKADADAKTAASEKLLAEAQAKTKQAEIDGYGGIENYLRYQCISSPTCGNPFRDQFLYGGAPPQ